MKRKTNADSKAAQTPASDMPLQETVSALAEPLTLLDKLAIVLFSLALFFAMTAGSAPVTLTLTGLSLALSIGRRPLERLRRHLSLPVLGLFAFALLGGCAAIYSSFGDSAVVEFPKLLVAFSLAVVLLARFEKRHVTGLLWGFGAICAVIGLLCIDAASSEALYQAFTSLMSRLGASYEGIEAGVSISNQIGGIFNNANLSGSLLALGMLVSLHLMRESKKLWQELLAALLLGVSALSFFLAMSRGAILCFGASLLVYLLAIGKQNRLSLFLTLMFSAAVTVGMSLVCTPLLGKGGLIPNLLAFATGVLIWLLYRLLARPLSAKLSGHGLAVGVVVAALAGLAAVYLVAGVTVTGPYTVQPESNLLRTLTLAPGEYTLSGDYTESEEGALTVVVNTRTDAQTLMQRAETLYAGPIQDAVFTVPEGKQVIDIIFYARNQEELRSITLSDGTALKLGYPLLPTFLANRMQGGIFNSSAYLLRLQYMKDGLTLFTQSPLIGHGLGSTEGLLTSVQPFFYESRYIHNHLIQIMDETGLLGLAAFLGMMGGVLWLLLRRLGQARDPLAAMLLACVAMMNLHGLMEISFSVRMYQCAAFFLLMLTVLLYARPLEGKAAKRGGLVTACALWAYLAVFGGFYASHTMVQKQQAELATTSLHEFLDACKSFVSRDVFDHEQAQLSFVGNALQTEGLKYSGALQKYVQELRNSGTYTACSGLARYYYLPKGQLEEVFAVSREGIAQEASTQDAWNLQFTFYRENVLPAIEAENISIFLNGVLGTADYLQTHNQDRVEEIVLTEENQAFLRSVESIQALGLEPEAAYLALLAATTTQEPPPAA